MARWGVETTTPKVLRDGRPRRTLYEVGASTIRNQMGWFWFEFLPEKQCVGLRTHGWRPSFRRIRR